MKRTVRRAVGALVVVLAVLAGGLATAGTASARSRPVGYTQVVVAPEVFELITAAGITPAPIAPGTAAPYLDTLATRYPITGYELRNLRIKHAGGVSLAAGDATIALEDFYIDLARLRVSGEVSGSIGDVGRVDLFNIRLSDRYRYGLVRLTLTGTAAGALNTTFGVEAFSAGDTFGYATPRPFGRFAHGKYNVMRELRAAR